MDAIRRGRIPNRKQVLSEGGRKRQHPMSHYHVSSQGGSTVYVKTKIKACLLPSVALKASDFRVH